MPEYLEVYNLKNKLIGISERNKFYNKIKAEFKKTGKITKKVKTIRVGLMSSNGRIYLQRRSKNKRQNPGLYDKTIGGHVLAGYGWEMTVTKECSEELGFPAAVLKNDKDLKLAAESTDLNIIGLFRAVDKINNFLSVRKDRGGGFYPAIY